MASYWDTVSEAQRQESERIRQQQEAERKAASERAARETRAAQEALQREQIRKMGEDAVRRSQEAAQRTASINTNIQTGQLPSGARNMNQIPEGARVAERNAKGQVTVYQYGNTRYYTPESTMFKMGYRTDKQWIEGGGRAGTGQVPGGIAGMSPYVPVVTGQGVMHITREEYNKLMQIGDTDERRAELRNLLGVKDSTRILSRDAELSDYRTDDGSIDLVQAVADGIIDPRDYAAAGITLNTREIQLTMQKVGEAKYQERRYNEALDVLKPYIDKDGNIDLVKAGEAINKGNRSVQRALDFMNVSRKDVEQGRDVVKDNAIGITVTTIDKEALANMMAGRTPETALQNFIDRYRLPDGSYNLAKMLREDQRYSFEQNLKDVFSKDAIDKAKEYNKNTLGVGWEKRDRQDYIERYFRAKGWDYLDPATAFVGVGSGINDKTQNEYSQRIIEASEAYQRDYGVKNTYAEFERAYYQDKGWIHPDEYSTLAGKTITGDDGKPIRIPTENELKEKGFRLTEDFIENKVRVGTRKTNLERRDQALSAYVDRFGVEPIINQSLTNVADFVIPGYYVTKNWNTLTTPEKAVNIAVDVLFVASIFGKPAAAGFRQLGKYIGESSAKGLNAVANRVSAAIKSGDVVRVRALGQSMIESGTKLSGRITGSVGEAISRAGRNLVALADDVNVLSRVRNPNLRQAVRKLKANTTVAGLGGEGGFLRIDEILKRPAVRNQVKLSPGERVRIGEYVISRSEAEAAARSTGKSIQDIEEILRRVGNDRQAFNREIANLRQRKAAFDEIDRAVKELESKSKKTTTSKRKVSRRSMPSMTYKQRAKITRERIQENIKTRLKKLQQRERLKASKENREKLSQRIKERQAKEPAPNALPATGILAKEKVAANTKSITDTKLAAQQSTKTLTSPKTRAITRTIPKELTETSTETDQKPARAFSESRATQNIQDAETSPTTRSLPLKDTSFKEKTKPPAVDKPPEKTKPPTDKTPDKIKDDGDDIRKRIRFAPPSSNASDDEKRQFLQGVEGLVARKRGNPKGGGMWLVDFYPYGPTDKMVIRGKPPAGAKDASGKGSLDKSATLIRGIAPKQPIRRDTGAVDDIIYGISNRKGIAVRSVRDYNSRVRVKQDRIRR